VILEAVGSVFGAGELLQLMVPVAEKMTRKNLTIEDLNKAGDET
jgi:hypothetical protein